MAEPENTQTAKESRFRGGVALKYPFESQNDYKGVIRFAILEDTPVNLANIWKELPRLGRELAGAGAQLTELLAGTAAETLDGAAGEGTQRVLEQTEETAEDINTKVSTHRGNQNVTVERIELAEARPGKSVEMYLPVGLVYRDNVGYENADLGVTGAAAAAAMRGGGNVTLGLQASIDSLKTAAASSQASLATTRILEKLPGAGGSSQAARAVAQVTVNPNTRSLFKSVSIREFSFQFKFLPVSAREAQEVKDIIQFFREELYPENIFVDDDKAISIGYKFPNKFGIRVMYDGKDIGTKILPCFLRDVNVTYNPTNMAMHSDGQFNEIDMTLSFTEHRTLDKTLVAKEGF